MNLLKKTTLAILAFAGHSAFSGTMGPVCTEGSVTLPCAHSAWDIGIQALYLKPAYGPEQAFFGIPNATNVVHWQAPASNWGWGFKLDGSYHVRTGNDININWYHFNHTTDSSVFTQAQNLSTILMHNTLNPKWDAINAELGQMVNFGEFTNIRFHGGAQYVQISQNYSGAFTGHVPEQIYVKYNGFGPRFGADLNHSIGSGFGIYANGAAALFVGDNKFNTLSSGVLDETGGSYASETIIVPEIEGKLGAKYTYAMTQGDLSLDVGYMWLNYIKAQSYISYSGYTLSTNFTLNGPYFGLNWLGSL